MLGEVHPHEELQRRAEAAQKSSMSTIEIQATSKPRSKAWLSLSRASDGALLISESGIGSADDIERLRGLGYRGFLIGETLMRADDPEELLAKFSLAQA